MTKCKRCGRELTNTKSIERGYGAICYRKLGNIFHTSKSRLETIFIQAPKTTSLEEYFT